MTGDPAFKIDVCDVNDVLVSEIGPLRRIDPAVTVIVLIPLVTVPREASPDPVSIVTFSKVVPSIERKENVPPFVSIRRSVPVSNSTGSVNMISPPFE